MPGGSSLHDRGTVRGAASEERAAGLAIAAAGLPGYQVGTNRETGPAVPPLTAGLRQPEGQEVMWTAAAQCTVSRVGCSGL
jgi:hypothetical protein